MKTNTPISAKGKASILRLPLLILFVLFVSVSVIPGGAPVSANIDSAQAIDECTHCGVSDGDICKFLDARGYVAYDHWQEPGTCNVMVKTQFEYLTRIVIEEGSIITAEDIYP
jgi:hypothetical protein